ncbi:hypothetical protein KUTeg_024371 [Tegillarca granosa]|uniref:Cytochrome P450 n=1 Tax=Tegillarca granosa TaxID=220873 RepID=A0ABQ9E2T7_TEGGR|nr:hypothetical protein KUTeg_024371 [Tegillarca granosa]
MEFIIYVVISLLALFMLLYQRSNKHKPVPGLQPTSEKDGNLSDINRFGSLHEFLLNLHERFGSIASFWMGQTYVVSIASPELFKQHGHFFNRPFKMYFSNIQTVANNLADKWSKLGNDNHICLSQDLSSCLFKLILRALFGKCYDDEEIIHKLVQNFNKCWGEMEKRLMELDDSGDVKNSALEEVYSVAKDIINNRKTNPPKRGEEKMLIDTIFETATSEDQVFSDKLIWCLYFLAKHQDLQDKVYEEIKTQLGNDEVDFDNIQKLRYTSQVLQETLRCAVIGPWTARVQESEGEIDGFKIPKDTPVIHALGVSFQDERYWQLPKKFNPDRFSPENSRSRPPMAFQPFGFSGKRSCVGYRFVFATATIFLVTLLKRFKIKIVNGEDVKPLYGLVTRPDKEIWVTIDTR